MSDLLVQRENGIPAIITRAADRLVAARSSAEVLEAKQIAEMALHYAKVMKAANETHADCLRIITRAEIRMADEVDRGQRRGEVARAGDNQVVRSADDRPATLQELGVSKQRLSEWREIRDAGPEVVEGAIQTALDEGRPPTKTDIVNHVRGTFGTGENEWYTPSGYLTLAREVLGGIDLDPASSDLANETVRAACIHTLEHDGLSKKWGGRVWMNPPYAQPWIQRFIEKLVEEYRAGHIEAAIALTHNYTDTAWFHAGAEAASAICFTRGRIAFVDPDGKKASPTQGQAFFYFGPDPERFAQVFSGAGFIAIPRGADA